MAADDFAVVVGIAKYPSFGETEHDARDLQGPDDDANDVAQWLVDPAGGNVPEANVHVVRTSLIPPGEKEAGWPQKEAITGQFDWLESLSQQNSEKHLGSRVGRRLYFYVSGHGFARRRREGAVFAGNATRVRRHHVFASRWIEWFGDAAYFDETVLWMDTCMVTDTMTPLENVGFRQLPNATGGARMFSAFAAKYPLQAVERTVDGHVRGIFTHTLLEGLRSGAVDPQTRQVTTSRLRNYLTNHMRDHLTEDDLKDDLISKEPDFGFDDDIVLCTLATVPQATVALHGFPPAADGQPFTIVTGAPPTEVAQGTVHGGTATVALRPGVHFLQMTNPVLASGFTVPGEANVSIDLSA